MNCNVCGGEIPERANVCPRCGTVVASSIDKYGVSMNGETIASSSNRPIAQTPPPYIPPSNPPFNAPYGSIPVSPYNAQQVPPYGSVPQGSPYDIPQWASSTSYGVDPYSVPPPPPQVTDPYQQGPQVAPYPPVNQSPLVPPPARKRGLSAYLIVGIVLLVFLLLFAGVGIFALTKHSTPPPVVLDPSANPYGPKVGTLVLNDTLQDNARGYQWDESSASPADNTKDTSACSFTNSTYHLKETQKGGLYCDPEAPALFLNNLAFEVKVSMLQGDRAGLIIREDQSKLSGYAFSIDSQGNYTLGMFDDSVSANNKTLRTGKSPAIKSGLNQVNLLAVSADGPTISAYVNNTQVTSLQDSTFGGGQVGIYAGGTNVAYDIEATSARLWRIDKTAPAVTENQNPYFPKTGTPAINDPMSDNSKGYAWEEYNAPSTTNKNDISICTFSGSLYHVSRNVTGGQYCFASGQGMLFDNLAYEAKETLTMGERNGLMFRYDTTKLTGYLFMIGIQQDYSLYSFNYKNPDVNKFYTLLRSGTNSVIKRGLRQTNTVGILARGSLISMYVNNQFIDIVQDTNYTGGEVGIYAESNGNGEETTASDVRLWKL